jgi:Na+/H+ antiporter NhaC
MAEMLRKKGFDWNYALAKLLKMVTGRKFLVLLFAVFASYGLEIGVELKLLVLFVAANVYAILTAYEDGKQARG